MKTFSKEILSIASICPKKGYRPQLQGIYINNGFVYATDSFRVIKIKDKQAIEVDEAPDFQNMDKKKEYGDDYFIPTTAITPILKALPKKATLPVLKTAWVVKDGDNEYLASTDLQSKNMQRIDTEISKKYSIPNFESIIPGKPEKSISVDRELLITLLQALPKDQYIKISMPDDYRKPVHITNRDGARFTFDALLMPIRD